MAVVVVRQDFDDAAIGNGAVMVTFQHAGELAAQARQAVFLLNNGVPDLIVVGVVSALFLNSALHVLARSYAEWRARPKASGEQLSFRNRLCKQW